ncbi:MAG: protein kinase [Tepidisphaera sp.]
MQRSVTCTNCGSETSFSSNDSATIVSPSRSANWGTGQTEVDPASLVGSSLGGDAYLLAEYLGRGAMGHVYRAVQRSLDRQVAIKVLVPELADNREFVDRFEREAKTVAKLKHPNIVEVYDFRREGAVCYLVMELLGGADGHASSLAQQLHDRGRLPFMEVRKLMLDALDALATAHAAGIVHRDIKPGNFLLDASGRIRLADFGLAAVQPSHAGAGQATKMTMVGTTMGSLGYMSPEQERDAGNVDARTDLYAMGVVLYELLIGEKPDFQSFLGGDREFRWPSRERRDVPPVVDDIIRRALQSKRELRYQTAQEFSESLAAAVSTPPSIVPVQAPTSTSRGSSTIPSASPGTSVITDARQHRRPLWPYAVGLSVLCVAGSALFGAEPLVKYARSNGWLPQAAQSATPEVKPTSSGSDIAPLTAGVTPPQANDDPLQVAVNPPPTQPPQPPAPAVDPLDRLELGKKIAERPGAVHEIDPAGNNLLMQALRAGKVDSAMLLIEQKSEVNRKAADGKTPLQLVLEAPEASISYNNKLILARALTDASAKADWLDADGNTPLHSFARGADPEMIRILYKSSDPTAKNKAGLTAACVASQELMGDDRKRTVETLVALGALFDCTDKFGNSPAHTAAAQGNIDELMAVLRNRKANEASPVGLRNAKNETPLHVAIRHKQLEAVRVLLNSNSDLTATDEGQNTPLHAAAEVGDVPIVQALLQKSDRLSDKNSAGQTPADVAKANNHPAVQQLFTPKVAPPPPGAAPLIKPANFVIVGVWEGDFTTTDGQVTPIVLNIQKTGANGEGTLKIGSGDEAKIAVYWSTSTSRLKVVGQNGAKFVLDPAKDASDTLDAAFQATESNSFVWTCSRPGGTAELRRRK